MNKYNDYRISSKQRGRSYQSERKNYDNWSPITDYELRSDKDRLGQSDMGSGYKVSNALQPSIKSKNLITNPLVAFQLLKRKFIQPSFEPVKSCLVNSRKFPGKYKRGMNKPKYFSKDSNLIMFSWESPKHKNKTHESDLLQRRTKSANQGPNLPFNMEFMLKQIKNKEQNTGVQNIKLELEEGLRMSSRGLSGRKKMRNNELQQFYADCIRHSQGRSEEMRIKVELRLGWKQNRCIRDGMKESKEKVEHIVQHHLPSQNETLWNVF